MLTPFILLVFLGVDRQVDRVIRERHGRTAPGAVVSMTLLLPACNRLFFLVDLHIADECEFNA